MFFRYFFTQYGPANIPNWQLAKVFTFESLRLYSVSLIYTQILLSLSFWSQMMLQMEMLGC